MEISRTSSQNSSRKPELYILSSHSSFWGELGWQDDAGLTISRWQTHLLWQIITTIALSFVASFLFGSCSQDESYCFPRDSFASSCSALWNTYGSPLSSWVLSSRVHVHSFKSLRVKFLSEWTGTNGSRTSLKYLPRHCCRPLLPCAQPCPFCELVSV